MIISNKFERIDREKDRLVKEKLGLKKGIDNLDKRYKNGEIDIEKFSKIANNYAREHKNINDRLNKR